MFLIRKISSFKTIFKNTTQSTLEKLYFSNFTAKDFLEHTSIDLGTLNTRFAKHIAIECNKNDKIVYKRIKYADYFPINDLRNFSMSLNKTPLDQLPKLVIFSYNYTINGEPHKIGEMLNKIDDFCVENIDNFKYDDLLNLMYSFTFVIPNKITKLNFYKEAIQKLVENFNPKVHNKDTFVKVCYYLGLWKKNQKSTRMMENFLKMHLNSYLTELDNISFAIIANSSFKTSVIVGNEEFKNKLIYETLNTNAENDDAIFITFIKDLRLEKIKSIEVYEKIKTLIVSGKLEKYHFKGLVHLFAYFTEGLWNDLTICEFFSKKCIKKIEEVGIERELFNDIREKDIATFLWCIANLKCKEFLTNSQLKLIENLILFRISRNKYYNCPDELIDSTLSLWMIDYKSEYLIEKIFSLNEKNLYLKNNRGRNNRNERIKLDSRLKLLINCIKIEKPEWLPKKFKTIEVFNENHEAPIYLTENRKTLNQIKNNILLDKNIDIKSVSYILPINDLNIPSIKIELDNNQKIFIEVLEDNMKLEFDEKDFIWMELKIRLLSKLGCNFILIKPSDLKNADNAIEMIKTKLNAITANEQIKDLFENDEILKNRAIT